MCNEDIPLPLGIAIFACVFLCFLLLLTLSIGEYEESELLIEVEKCQGEKGASLYWLDLLTRTDDPKIQIDIKNNIAFTVFIILRSIYHIGNDTCTGPLTHRFAKPLLYVLNIVSTVLFVKIVYNDGNKMLLAWNTRLCIAPPDICVHLRKGHAPHAIQHRCFVEDMEMYNMTTPYGYHPGREFAFQRPLNFDHNIVFRKSSSYLIKKLIKPRVENWILYLTKKSNM